MNEFFQSYGLLIILVVAFALIMLSYYFRNKKFQESESKFQSALKKGDKVKTYSGFYGEVEKISETTDGKVVTLKLGAKSSIDVDIRAISGLDNKQDVAELEAQAEPVVEPAVQPVVVAPAAEVAAEKPAEKPAEEVVVIKKKRGRPAKQKSE